MLTYKLESVRGL